MLRILWLEFFTDTSIYVFHHFLSTAKKWLGDVNISQSYTICMVTHQQQQWDVIIFQFDSKILDSIMTKGLLRETWKAVTPRYHFFVGDAVLYVERDRLLVDLLSINPMMPAIIDRNLRTHTTHVSFHHNTKQWCGDRVIVLPWMLYHDIMML